MALRMGQNMNAVASDESIELMTPIDGIGHPQLPPRFITRDDNDAAAEMTQSLREAAQVIGTRINQTATVVSQRFNQFIDQMSNPSSQNSMHNSPRSQNQSQLTSTPLASTRIVESSSGGSLGVSDIPVDELLAVDEDAIGKLLITIHLHTMCACIHSSFTHNVCIHSFSMCACIHV